MLEERLLVERGIGEVRQVLGADGRIVEASIFREGVVPAGTILEAQLKSVGPNCLATADGQSYLLPSGAPGTTQGAKLTIEVTREALGGTEPWKRALARATGEAPRPMPAPEGHEVAGTELDKLGWLDLLDEARSGLVTFPGGELRVSLTPAMTLIDVDGRLPAAELAVAGARAAAAAIRRHGIGGSIGIDLPTVSGKAARQAAGEAIDGTLPKPFERTAVNGFGFLQIVRPRHRPSLFELAADRGPFEARALVRLASRQIGSVALVAHPAVIAVLDARPGWIGQLSRQVGGTVTLQRDPSLAISAGYAERHQILPALR